MRKKIIDRLKEASPLRPEVIKRSRGILEELNGAQLGYVLELYNQHTIHDITTCRSVGELLKKAYDAQLEGRFSDRAELLEWLKESI